MKIPETRKENQIMNLSTHRLISRELHKPTESRTNPNQENLEKLIEVQNKEYYELYDNLASYVSDEDRTIILRANIQMIPNSKTEVSVHCTFHKGTFIKIINKLPIKK